MFIRAGVRRQGAETMKREQFNQVNKLFLVTLILLTSAAFASAQVAAGGNYKLDQSVIAGGGGTSADATGNTYSITGAIGQSIAGSGTNNSIYKVQSGFFTAAPLAPTAATVSVSGRVLTAEGRGIRNVILIMNDSSGSLRTTTTTAFGYYSFNNVPAGETYIITARGKRFSFVQPTQILNVNEDTEDINFIGNPTPSLRDF